jgi:2-polyprenyl-6-hydroxyphenyl methylase/3-demethylubiquinone-9 3-methyltransferase
LILASSLLGWYVLPPEEFSDRLHVIPSSNVTIDISLYDDPKYSKAWFDEDGWASILHKMNPTRVAYFDKVFTKTLKDKKASLLEIGCGGGLLTIALAQKGYNVTGLDISSESLQAAAGHAAKLGLEVQFKSGTVYDVPAVDDAFDAVILTEVTEKLLNLPQAFKEISRVLKPGGVVVFDTINRTWKSWLVVANLMESSAVRNGFPPKFHDWRLFVRPDELDSILAQHRIAGQEFVGLTPIWELPSFDFVLQGAAKINITRFEQTTDLDLLYMGYAINAAH